MVLVRTTCGRRGVFELLFSLSPSRLSLSLSLVSVLKKEAFPPVVARRLPPFFIARVRASFSPDFFYYFYSALKKFVLIFSFRLSVQRPYLIPFFSPFLSGPLAYRIGA